MQSQNALYHPEVVDPHLAEKGQGLLTTGQLKDRTLHLSGSGV
jgi:hypothetical protein